MNIIRIILLLTCECASFSCLCLFLSPPSEDWEPRDSNYTRWQKKYQKQDKVVAVVALCMYNILVARTGENLAMFFFFLANL